jgi:two-component system response regulator YesN
MYSINNIVEEYVKDKFKMAYLVYEHNRMIWLLQPIHTQVEPVEKNEALDNHTWLLGILESIQVACKQYLKILASFVVSSVPYEWEQLSIKSGKLLLLFERGLGLGKEMLLSDERMFAKRKNLVSSRVSRVRLLDQYLLQKDQEQFYEHYDEIMKIVDGPDALQTGLSLEIFYEITAIFITHMNRMDLFSQLSEQFNVSKLLSINEHATWKDVTVFFRELSVHLFASMESENETETHEIVMLVHEYIEMNLANDLSLNVLASHVYLTPFYLSRLFKAKTGTSISDYTTEARIDKARQLLAETGLKIHEIGLQIGFDSASYFSRFFKKATNMTPQEYRDSNKRI